MARYQRHESRVGATGSYIFQFCTGFEGIAFIPDELAQLWIGTVQTELGGEQTPFRLEMNPKAFIVVHSDDKLDCAIYRSDRRNQVCIFDKLEKLPGRVLAHADEAKRQKIDQAREALNAHVQPYLSAKRQAEDAFVQNIGRQLIESGDEDAWREYDAFCTKSWDKYTAETAGYEETHKARVKQAESEYADTVKPAYEWHNVLPLPEPVASGWKAVLEGVKTEDARDHNEIAIDLFDGVWYLKLRL